MNDNPMLAAALDLAGRGWEVFPLLGKVPAIPRAHPRGVRCSGGCGKLGHGVLDATTDPEIIRAMFSDPRRQPGARVPAGLFVLDVDPRSGGDDS